MKLRLSRRALAYLGLSLLGIIGCFVVSKNHSNRTAAPSRKAEAAANAPARRPSSPPRTVATPDPSAERGNRIAAIVAELETGRDAPTGLAFRLGPGGRLIDAPTRRLALLDELSQLDPKIASSVAEKILAEFGSPDEWAVSLRNYALAHPGSGGKAFLEAKLRAMLSHRAWREAPSVGFLEAFDVGVYLEGTTLLPLFTELMRERENQALAHAAYLAVDRLVIGNPAATLRHLLDDSDGMLGREITRANFFARADVSDPSQKEILEAYLLSVGRPSPELGTFADLFPNFNYMVSHNLLTSTTTPSGATIASRDRVSLRQVEAWLGEARFAPVKPHLEKIRCRLTQFVEPKGVGP